MSKIVSKKKSGSKKEFDPHHLISDLKFETNLSAFNYYIMSFYNIDTFEHKDDIQHWRS